MDASPDNHSHRTSREDELAALLIDMAPLLRSRIRARRGRRLGHIGTSDIYASVTRRALELERSEGLQAIPASAAAGLGEQAPRGLWKLLRLLVDRVIVDATRRERAHGRAATHSSRARAAREHAGPEQTALRADEQARLRELVGMLSDLDRELIMLRLSGCEWSDIARTIGGSAANCRQRWHRLAERLAEALGER
jgi:DNA-directed RNA polymerase specialized sigma24 family protein